MRAVPLGHKGLYSGLVLRHCEEIKFGDQERTEPGSAVIITPEDGASRSLPECRMPVYAGKWLQGQNLTHCSILAQ